MPQSDFSEAELTHATFIDSKLEESDLSDSDIRHAEFEHSKIGGTYFSGARVSSTTEFGKRSSYETIADHRATNAPLRRKIKNDIIRLLHWLAYGVFKFVRFLNDHNPSDKLQRIISNRILDYSLIVRLLPQEPSLSRNTDTREKPSKLSESQSQGFRTAAWRFSNRLASEYSFTAEIGETYVKL